LKGAETWKACQDRPYNHAHTIKSQVDPLSTPLQVISSVGPNSSIGTNSNLEPSTGIGPTTNPPLVYGSVPTGQGLWRSLKYGWWEPPLFSGTFDFELKIFVKSCRFLIIWIDNLSSNFICIKIKSISMELYLKVFLFVLHAPLITTLSPKTATDFSGHKRR
jgi:hypothetical protein